METVTYDKEITALLVIDPYNDFISEGGKVWDRLKDVAEANHCVPHMLQVLNAARKADIRVFYALHRRYRPGDYESWKYIAPIQKAAWSHKTFENGTWGGEIRREFEPQAGEIVALEHWGSSGFANTDLDLQLERHGIHQLIVMGSWLVHRPESAPGVPRAKNERSIMLRKKIIMVVLISLIAGPLMAQEAKVTSLMSKELREFSGKEGLMITVEYAPGGSDPVHRHDAHAFIYVLEGSIVMQVKGGEEVTLTPGQTFYEGPNDVHVVGRNASSTKPAKFLVFFVKDKGAPVLVPVK